MPSVTGLHALIAQHVKGSQDQVPVATTGEFGWLWIWGRYGGFRLPCLACEAWASGFGGSDRLRIAVTLQSGINE